MKKIKFISPFLLLSAVLLLSACTKQMVTKTTFNDISKNDEISHILVLSIGRNNQGGPQFENRLASAISQKGIKTTGFHANKKPRDEISETSVKSLVDEVGVDAVLVTKLVSIEFDSQIKTGRVEAVKTPLNHGLRGVFQEYEVTDLYNPEQININADLKINASLYSVKTEKLLWSADTATFKRDDRDNVINDFVTSISTELMKKLR